MSEEKPPLQFGEAAWHQPANGQNIHQFKNMKTSGKQNKAAAVAPATASEPTTPVVKSEAAGTDKTISLQADNGNKDSVEPTTDEPTSPLVDTEAIVMVSVDALKPHPLSIATYGTGASDELIASVREYGIMNALIVARATMEIVSGNSRAEAARVNGVEEVPVVFREIGDPLAVQAAVLEANTQRITTPEQKIRVFSAWKRIETERAKLRNMTNLGGSEPVKKFTQAEKGKARDKAADKVGFSGVTGDKGAAVVEVIDRLSRKGKRDKVELVRDALNQKSISTAHKLAIELKFIKPKKEQGKKTHSRIKGAKMRGKKGATAKVSDTKHGKALEGADRVVTFLRENQAAIYSKAQQAAWVKIAGEIQKLTKTINTKAA